MSIVAHRQNLEVQEVARRIMLGQSTTQISREMDVSEEHVRKLCRTQEMADVIGSLEDNMFKELDAKLQDKNVQLFTRLQARQSEAFEKLCSLMRFSKDDRLQANIAMDMLDRGGHSAPKTQIHKAEISLDPITAKVLAKAFQESLSNGNGHSKVIDVKTE